MTRSLRALLAGIIDCAGLFPPAKLPLEQAIGNYLRYGEEPDGWMRGRFICPAVRLMDVSKWLDDNPYPAAAVDIAVIGQARNAAEFTTGLREDLARIRDFKGLHTRHVNVEVYEGKLPADALDPASSDHFIVKNVNAAFNLVCPVATHYFEAVPEPYCRWSVRHSIACLARTQDQDARDGSVIDLVPGGFKLRCGGPDPAAIPTSAQTAFTIASCRDLGIPLKFTAGLHHPLRHHDAELGVPVHGFINLFVAGVLAHARQLTEEQLRPIIEDEDPGSFHFDDPGLGWKDQSATTAEISAARQQLVVSFGSCSFDEPHAGLMNLGWLESRE